MDMAEVGRYLSTLYVLLLFSLFTRISSDFVVGHDEGVDANFNFDGLPGATHEFKIEVQSGKADCFYQHVVRGGQLYISFEVLRGADRNIDFVVKNPDGSILENHLWKADGYLDKKIEQEGVYEVCLDNGFSRYSSKLVYLYLVTFVPTDWDKYSKEIEKIDSSLGNSTNVLGSVDHLMSEMLRYQAISRQHVIADWYIIQNNNSYIQNWSILQIVVIVAISAFQAYFVRKLFNVKNVTPNEKPRA